MDNLAVLDAVDCFPILKATNKAKGQSVESLFKENDIESITAIVLGNEKTEEAATALWFMKVDGDLHFGGTDPITDTIDEDELEDLGFL